MVKKKSVIKHFGSVAKVAAFFGVSRQAVYLWDELPKERQYELALRLPNVFASKWKQK